MRVVVVNHVSLDGVYQGPGRLGEDESGGFRHSGWAQQAGSDPALGRAMGACMGDDFSWLLGRRSYEDMLAHWNEVGGPFKDSLNDVVKYVATSDPKLDLPWPNSRRLCGGVAAKVAELRDQQGGNLVVMGSGQLIGSLLAESLIDEILLMVHPLVLGSGAQLFGPTSDPFPLELVNSEAVESGVVVATYRLA